MILPSQRNKHPRQESLEQATVICDLEAPRLTLRYEKLALQSKSPLKSYVVEAVEAVELQGSIHQPSM